MARTPVLRAAEREIHVFRRLWRGSLSFAFVQPLLFLAAMGLGLGGLIERNQGQVGGVSYLAFVAPGLMAASAMMVGTSEALWPLMGRLKWVGSYGAMVATPVTAADAYGGWLIWIAVRSVLGAAAFFIAAAVLGAVPSLWGIFSIPAVVLCALAFAAPVGAFTATQESDFRFPLIMRLGIMPLFLFSGTFFPLSQLPDWLETLAWLSPLWHGIELARGATTGRIGLGSVAVHAVVLVLPLLSGWAWGVRTFRQRLTP